VLLSHAETDLLALERARSELPAGFPTVVGHSLLGLSSSDALIALFAAGVRRSCWRLCAFNGTVSSVSGLAELIALAHREGWALVVISVSEAALSYCPHLERKARTRIESHFYFMAGGVANVARPCAMRRRSTSDLPWDFEPAPTDARSWSVSPRTCW